MTLTLTINQLSNEINLAVKTIRSRLVRNPESLPPRLEIDGQKKLLWLWTDVQDFYLRQKRVHGTNPAFSNKKIQNEHADQMLPPKRGRPTKASQIKRDKNRDEPAK